MICYLYINELIDFHSLRSDHMPNETMQFLSKRILVTNSFRPHEYDSEMGDYFRIGFIDYMLPGRSVTGYIVQPTVF